MGAIETGVKARVRRTKINRAVIAAVAIVGGIAIAAVAPNVLGAMGRMGLLPRRRQAVRRSFSRLVSGGYITLAGESSSRRARLTPRGEKLAALMGEGRLVPKKPRRWDGKWRVLIFDIVSRRTRDQVRATLLKLGLFRLQDSVWVYPYDCEDLITLFKIDLKVGKDLLYIVADAIEYDMPLRQHFDLPRSR